MIYKLTVTQWQSIDEKLKNTVTLTTCLVDEETLCLLLLGSPSTFQFSLDFCEVSHLDHPAFRSDNGTG